MFAFQHNNDTRAFEYPWAYHAAELDGSVAVLEVGGGLSGFQFVLSAEGHRVDNVDPGMEDLGWPVSPEMMEKLNNAFRTNVRLFNQPLLDAPLQHDTYDRAFSISVLEHFPESELPRAMQKVYRVLKAEGRFVLTVDLFLDLFPFTRKRENRFGRNVSIRELLEGAPFRLEHGVKSELFGFDEFDPEAVLELLPDLLIGGRYPVVVQTLVLRKI
jgi:SAM-dependent methyltransferase